MAEQEQGGPERWQPPTGAGDETAPLAADRPDEAAGPAAGVNPPLGGGLPPDATAYLPPVSGQDAPGLPDETAVLPTGLPPGQPAGAAPWYARAEVPQPVVPVEQTGMWSDVDPAERDRWWLPLLIGLLALILLGLLGLGLWVLFLRDANPATPTPTPTAITTRRPSPSPVPSPTSARPSTRPSSASPSPTPPELVVPALVGQSLPDARARLDSLGLPYRLKYQVTDEVPADEVLSTDPRPGTAVAPGTVVTLVVAEKPAPTASPSDTPTTEPTL